MNFESLKRGKAEVVFTRKKIPFVQEEIMFQGKKTSVWKANFRQGDCSFSCFLKATPKGKYKTDSGKKEIGYYMTITMFDDEANNNRR